MVRMDVNVLYVVIGFLVCFGIRAVEVKCDVKVVDHFQVAFNSDFKTLFVANPA